MGSAASKCYGKQFADPREQRTKIMALEEEIRALRTDREKKEQAFALERRKLKEEVARLRKKAREEEETARRMEAAAAAAIAGCGGGTEAKECECWQLGRDSCVIEHMMAEQARKEATVEKWKQLYSAIKDELDELILRTKEGGQLCWGSELGAMVQSLKRELKAKDEALEALKAKLVAMEGEGARREGQIDILRQSLRILSCTERSRGRRNLKRILRFYIF